MQRTDYDQHYQRAMHALDQKTKPPGSLGQLESVAAQVSAIQQSLSPDASRVRALIFAADHGITDAGVSAYPKDVTRQMLQNFSAGGAAINALCNQNDIDLQVINTGVIGEPVEGTVNAKVADGTVNMLEGTAMSEDQLNTALQAGRDAVNRAVKEEYRIITLGEMGIGNTTSASAIYSLLLNQQPEVTVGPGTGIDANGISIKQKVLHNAFKLHAGELESPLDILAKVGGLEIAALVGAYIGAAQAGVPILVDGFITTAAALLAVRINPSCREWMIFAHKSAEPAHYLALKEMDALPLLDLGLRLGEGSGAALAVPLIQSALALHNQMATFADAGVSDS